MIDFQEKFLKIFYAGILLLSVCVIGICISSTSQFNDIDLIQKKILVVPYVISYTLIFVGLLGYVFNLIRKWKN